MKHIKIDRYETRLENRRPVTYAVKGDKSYLIPDAFVPMCDDSHMAIAKAHTDYPDLYDTAEDYYVPLRTN